MKKIFEFQLKYTNNQQIYKSKELKISIYNKRMIVKL